MLRKTADPTSNQRSVIFLELKSMGPTYFGLRLKPESDLDVWPEAPMVVGSGTNQLSFPMHVGPDSRPDGS